MFWGHGDSFLVSPRTLTRPGRFVVGSLADRSAQLTQVGLQGHEVIAL